MKTTVIILTFVLSTLSFSETIKTSDITQGKFKCSVESKTCFYRSFLEARNLTQKLRNAMFPLGNNDPVTERFIPMEQYLISYWFDDSELKSRFENLLILLDTKESLPSNTPFAMFNVGIYTVTEEAYSGIKAQIGSGSLDTSSGHNTLSFSYGYTTSSGNTLSISAALSAQYQKNNVKEEQSYEVPLKNLDYFEKKDLTTLYIFSPTGTTEKEYEGLYVAGFPSIDINDKSLITFRNFQLKYGIKTVSALNGVEQFSMKTIDTGNMDLTLMKGQSLILFSSSSMQNTKVRGIGFTNTGGQRTRKNVRLMIIVSARSFDLKKYMKMSAKNSSKKLGEFSKKEIRKLSKKRTSLKTALKHIQAKSFFMPGSIQRPYIKFYLNKKFATRTNYNKWVEITVKAKGYKTKKTLKIENLVKTGLLIDDFSPRLLSNDRIRIKVKFKEVKKRMPIRSLVKRIFYYKPETSEFINVK